MKQSLALTGEGIARALGRVAELPAVDAAVRERAEAVARDVGGHVMRRGAGDYVITAVRQPTHATPPTDVMPAKAGTQ